MNFKTNEKPQIVVHNCTLLLWFSWIVMKWKHTINFHDARYFWYGVQNFPILFMTSNSKFVIVIDVNSPVKVFPVNFRCHQIPCLLNVKFELQIRVHCGCLRVAIFVCVVTNILNINFEIFKLCCVASKNLQRWLNCNDGCIYWIQVFWFIFFVIYILNRLGSNIELSSLRSTFLVMPSKKNICNYFCKL